MIRSRVALTAALVLVGCSKPASPPTAAASHAPVSHDSLVLTLPDSTEVWLVTGRQGIGADQATCDEHSVELRKEGRKHLVPLLYVRAVPKLIGGKLVATLSNRCADVAEYVVDPVTAQPTLRGAHR